MEIDRYKDVVDRLAVEKKDSRFTNKGPNHARVVVAAMLNNATSNVKFLLEHCPAASTHQKRSWRHLRLFWQKEASQF